MHCPTCKVVFTCAVSLKRHRVKAHGENLSAPFDRYPNRCLEGCQTSYRMSSELVNHLLNQHGINIKSEHFKFPSWDAFQKWKANEELVSNCQYPVVTGKKTNKMDFVTHYYNCNRSSRQLEEVPASKKKCGKLKGSKKVDLNCTSRLVVVVCPKGEVEVTYWKGHYGHDQQQEKDQSQDLVLKEFPSLLEEDESVRKTFEEILAGSEPITCQDIDNMQQELGLCMVRENPISSVEEITERHAAGLALPEFRLEQLSDGWFINDAVHIRRLQDSSCCEWLCPDCKVCVHQYSCSCVEATAEQTVCPHVHRLVYQLSVEAAAPAPAPSGFQAGCITVTALQPLHHELSSKAFPDLSPEPFQVVYMVDQW